MNLDQMIVQLNGDLKNEWKHLRFYLHHASLVTGLIANEHKEFLLKAASGEMGHVSAFSDLIVGLGGIPTTYANEFPSFLTPQDILAYALRMEEEVVINYAMRLAEAEELTKNDAVNGRWVQIFLEGQLEDSRKDADLLKQMLRTTTPPIPQIKD